MKEEFKEIGGYFGLEEFGGQEYYPDAAAVNSGRNALLYILKCRKAEKIYIPRFLCDSVFRMCQREGIPYGEYDINDDFTPDFRGNLGDGEYLYIVNYYGQISKEQIKNFKIRYGRIIIDNVQAFFQKPAAGEDTVYSCRKFFGVPDGGYAFTEENRLILTKIDVSRERMNHILGRFEESGSVYYDAFRDNDEKFYHLPLRGMSRITHNILRGVNYGQVREKRNANFSFLADNLGGLNGKNFKFPDGAYCYPFYCKNGPEIRRILAEKRIYVATLWPNVIKNGSGRERDFAENILPLPCDQRYGEEDMGILVREIKKII